jgi:hypothetical protein
VRIHGLTTITLVSTVLALAACPEEGDDATDEAGPTTTEDSTTGDGDTTGDSDTSGDGDTTSGDGDTTSGDGDTTSGDGDTTDGDSTDTGNVNDACMGMVAPAGTLTVGQPVSHWGGGFTVEGDEWDYCQMGGTPFLLILSAGWCGPCHDLASGFAGQPSSWDPAVLAPVIAGMEAGTLGVVELVVDNFSDFDATSLADLQSWEMMHPNEHIHLLGDPTPGVNGEEVMWQYLAPSHMGGVPSGILVDADFNLEVIDLQGSITTAGMKYGG